MYLAKLIDINPIVESGCFLRKFYQNYPLLL